jgi:sugar/nucleoside kinase (ribokinase family)
MKKYQVVGLGGCGVDLKASVPALPNPHTHKIIASKVEISEGGVTSDNLVQCGKLGLKTAWVGTLGDDHWAGYLLEAFKKTNVLVPRPVKLKGIATQQFWICVDPHGEAIAIGVPEATRALTAAIVKTQFTEIIKSAEHFHTEVAVIPLAPALEGAKIAQRAGVKVLLDVDGDPFYLIDKEKIGSRKEFLELLKHTDVVKMSKPAILGLTGKSKLEPGLLKNIFKFGPKVVVVTQAENGCMIADKNKTEIVPGIKVRAKDTVGAGDAFMGGLSYALLKKWDLRHVAAFANACGAFKATQVGTRASGNLRQVLSLL